MPKSSKLEALRSKLKVGAGSNVGRDPRVVARLVLGVLVLANLVAAAVAFRPWSASPEQIETQLLQIRQQQMQRRAQIERLRILEKKAEKARKEGDQFLEKYFLARRTASSTLVSELNAMAKAAGIKPKDHSIAFEPVEGSDTLAMMTITGNYQGSYADLIQYVNRLDRSSRLFIVESLAAAPLQGQAGVLNINMKIHAFVQEEGPRQLAAHVPEAAR